MTFVPNAGLWSEESFSSLSGATLNDPTLQGITGGYAALLPTIVTSSSFVRTWNAITGWNMQNGLQDITVIDDDFSIYSGVVTDGDTSGQNGSQRSVISAGAWEIKTTFPPTGGDGLFTGQEFQTIVLDTGSPDNQWTHNFTGAGSTRATIEFDVVSLTNLTTGNPLQGFTTGQENLTGLDPLTGILNHGVYIDNNTSWDYIEVSPFGLRSANHPELAIPIDFTRPKRVRIGLRDSDIFIGTEDGKVVAGLGKFNTPVTVSDDAKLAFGAPRYSGNGYQLADNAVSGLVGETLWGFVNVRTGVMEMSVPEGLEQHYSTSTATMFTAPFDPQVGISTFNTATVGFIPYNGGDTTITAQYSGSAGWTDSSVSQNVRGLNSPAVLDLTTVPVFSYPRSDFGTNYTSNPIRFKIEQLSDNGTAPAPPVDFITLVASKEGAYLDIVPNWRPKDLPVTLQLGIRTGTFLTDDPKSDLWTSVLLNFPVTGLHQVNQGAIFVDEGRSGIPVLVTGEAGELVAGGPFDTAFQTYTLNSGQAISGSTAATYFGTDLVENFFPNPLLDEGFRNVSGEAQHYIGRSAGEIAQELFFVPAYTGQSTINFSKTEVFRPENQARVQRINSYLGRSQSPIQEYVQTVEVVPGSFSGTYDFDSGLEARIPSGIPSGQYLFSFDAQVTQGTGISVYATGDSANPTGWFLPGELVRNYRPISYPVDVTGGGEVRLGFVMPSGAPSAQGVTFNIDNITFSPMSTAYLYATGLPSYLHESGLVSKLPPANTGQAVKRAATVIQSHLFLDSYPEDEAVLVHITGGSSRGAKVYIDNSGYLNAWVDTDSSAWAEDSSSQPWTEFFGRHDIKSEDKVPLGRWTHWGFIHQAHTSQLMQIANNSGALSPYNFATNRAYLTIDGFPTQSVDLMSGWYNEDRVTVGNDRAPWVTYMTMSGNVTLTAFSGLYGKVDGFHISRPPIAEAEAELSVRGARVTAPYIHPDVLFKPSLTGIENALTAGLGDNTLGNDVFLGSFYNFDSPGYSHWDHGLWKNHLIFRGTVSKQTGSPYTNFPDIGHTLFSGESYAVARYSSMSERVLNHSGQLNTLTSWFGEGANRGIVKGYGWYYPHTTGIFFEMVEDEAVLGSGERYVVGLDTSRNVFAARDTATGVVWAITGQQVDLRR
ncbi:MAG: hypothetical protein ACXABY_02960 [Candidatus Thorarchaeota archaeon]|jgi:hypothetical protein